MSRSIELLPDVIDVWTAPLDGGEHTIDDLLERLSQGERQRVGGLIGERAVRQYVVSRAIQRQLLAGYAGGLPSEVSFGMIGMGKPTLSKPNAIGLTFNTTHSGNLVVIAVTKGREVGVDVERVKEVPRALQVAKRFFSSDEYRMLEALPAGQIDRAFLSIWVRREGTAKARGDSVWRGLASWNNGALEHTARDWTVAPLDLGPEFVGVVVAPGSDWRIVMRGRPPGF